MGHVLPPALVAVIANPDDLAQRLVYADWLEQQGELPSAEMIRLGVEVVGLGGLPRPHFGAAPGLELKSAAQATRCEAIRARMLEIDEPDWTWRRALPVFDKVSVDGDLSFGGILEGVTAASWSAFAAGADTLAEVMPLRALTLLHLDIRGARALVRSGWLGRLRHLSFHGGRVSAAALELVLDADDARGLVSLDLSMMRLGDRGAERVAWSPNLSGLEALFLYMNGIGDRAAVSLASSPHLHGLRALNLELNHLGADAARTFLTPQPFPQMVYLNLFDNEGIEDGGFEPALRERWGDRLEI